MSSEAQIGDIVLVKKAFMIEGSVHVIKAPGGWIHMLLRDKPSRTASFFVSDPQHLNPPTAE